VTYVTVAAGAPLPECAVGDFVLVNRGKYIGKLIRLGQAVRFRGSRRRFAQWNHAALVVSGEGDLVEALVRTGATRSHLEKYANVDYVLVRTGCVPLDQTQVLAFADGVVGQEYGFLDDFSTFLNYLTGNKVVFTTQGSIMCSQLVARALERAGAFFARNTATVAPADLAEHFGVAG
jgi:hypothetical protein